MNLFCFTLEGSTESMYEPAYSQTIREVRPKYQCSPALLRRRPEWGSDPAINSSKSQSRKIKRNNIRSCFLTSPLDNETIDIHRTCWISSGDKKDLAHQKKVPDKETCRLPGNEKVKKMDHERLQTKPTLQASETAADTAESIKARRLKKLQNLVPTKGVQQSAKEKSTPENYDHLTNMLTTHNPVFTCIGLGKRERNTTITSPSPHQELDNLSHENSEEETAWSPLESPSEPWSPQYLSCHQPGHDRHELWQCGSALSLPRTAAWDRYESLIQELDNKQSDFCLPLPQMIRSITDLDLQQDALTRFGRFDAFRQQWPLVTARDNGSSCSVKQQDWSGDLIGTCLKEETEETLNTDSKPIKANETTMTMEVIRGRDFSKGHSNSLESLYSSGQSSSSGVTSGSNCSSNRGSLRLDDEVSAHRHFCGRARVHTEFVPSPYDTESLKLQVGDVIDIISKPPMGTWTGMLNNKVGFFKFIYVDLLKDDHPPDSPKPTNGNKCIKELLQHFDLEEYVLTLLLHGYQTSEDLLRLGEHQLIELRVTDPEHRRRLLAAVSSLQPPHADRQEAMYANVKICPRDSGCVMGLESPDSAADLHSPYEQSPTATVIAS